MADSAQERSEQATPRKLEKAREKGQVALSRDLTGAAVLIVAAVVVYLSVPGAAATLVAMTRDGLARCAAPAPATAIEALQSSLSAGAALALPLLATLFLTALVVTFLQVGPLLSLEPLTPKLERLNPVEGLRNRLFKLRSMIELSKSALKVALAALLCVQVVWENFEEIIRVASRPPAQIVHLSNFVLAKCATRVLGAVALLAVADFFYQRWQFRRDQRMSKQEVTREQKDSDGDPHHKAARRQMHRDLAENNMLGHVPDGDVVVRNPTHIACVLRFDPLVDAAPRLVAKGSGWLAESIIRIAEASRVPSVRNVPLARALRELELQELIPAELYVAAAEALRWAAETAESRGQTVRWKQALSVSQSVKTPDSPPLPPDLSQRGGASFDNSTTPRAR